MEIKRLNDNRIRCALTENEIEDMGFCIDDIIGNGEITQKFMRVVLERIEAEEDIDTTLLSPMVRAELLPDHSMAITFGGITEEEKKEMFGKLLEMMEQMKEKPEENSTKEKKELLESEKPNQKEEKEVFPELTDFGLQFMDINHAVQVSKVLLKQERCQKSSFYKMNGAYYLLLNVTGSLKEELRPLIFMGLEYANRSITEPLEMSYIKEHGKCILEKEAISVLRQL